MAARRCWQTTCCSDYCSPSRRSPGASLMRGNIERLPLGLLTGFVVVGLTLGYWQFFRQDELLARATNPRIAEEARRVVRGRILDRTGKPLAENVPTDD